MAPRFTRTPYPSCMIAHRTNTFTTCGTPPAQCSEKQEQLTSSSYLPQGGKQRLWLTNSVFSSLKSIAIIPVTVSPDLTLFHLDTTALSVTVRVPRSCITKSILTSYQRNHCHVVWSQTSGVSYFDECLFLGIKEGYNRDITGDHSHVPIPHSL